MSEPIDLTPLYLAIERLLAEIEAQSLNGTDQAISPERLEKMAKSVTAQLKAMTDIEQHNARIRHEESSQNYIAYEDLPPPNPEERARIAERFQQIAGQLLAGLDIPDFSEKASS